VHGIFVHALVIDILFPISILLANSSVHCTPRKKVEERMKPALPHIAKMAPERIQAQEP
jgi:hypothetical protein